MKKLISTLMMVLLLVLTACGGSERNQRPFP